MIYLDSSVALAFLQSERRRPAPGFWDEPAVSSRLLEYEVWNRLHARQLGPSHGVEARRLLDRVDFVELTRDVLAQALRPLPIPVRTLDGLHLATVAFLRAAGRTIELASHDTRLLDAARALGIPAYEP